VKPAAFEYVRAASVAEAASLLAEGAPNARLLAGGQSLGPLLNLRLVRPSRLIDLKRAAGMREVAADETTFRIGAGWTHAEVEDGAVEDPARGLLRHVARGIAYRAVRNRGTIGGSLAHADPAADWVSALAALGGAVIAQGRGGAQRSVPMDAFLRGAFATALTADEVLVAVETPRLSAQARWGYHKICRKTGEFAKAIGVAVLDPMRGFARVLAGAVEAAPVLLSQSGARLLEAGPKAVVGLAEEEMGAALRHLAPAERALRVVAVKRALLQLEQG
jgi:aerobic carbon-monoxide dehydrogenase medium subunit